MNFVKNLKQNYNANKIKNDPLYADNIDEDTCQINMIMYINYGVKILALTLFVFSMSYFVGIFWLIVCQITKQQREHLWNEHSEEYDDGLSTFLDEYEFDQMT